MTESSELLLIDESHIAALRATMGAADFDRLMTGAPARLQDRIDRLQSALGAGDFEALEREAHKLISGAGYVGAKALSLLAFELETNASRKDRGKVDSLMRAIGDKAPATLAALRAKGDAGARGDGCVTPLRR